MLKRAKRFVTLKNEDQLKMRMKKKANQGSLIFEQ